jgi:phosphoglycerol transferase MdoB-like AlkP superfamily enzyme
MLFLCQINKVLQLKFIFSLFLHNYFSMKNFILSILKYFVYWFAIFFLQRNIFLFYFYKTTSFSFKEWIFCNIYSIHIDIATFSYILLPLLLIFIIQLFAEIKNTRKYIKYYTYVILIVSNIILVTDLGLFAEWGLKINHKAISYLIYPQEVINSAKITPVFLLLTIFIALSFFSIWFYKKCFIIDFKLDKIKWVQKVLIIIPLFFLCFLGLRGGLQTFPIDRSWSYFSEKTLLNHAAVNSSWNFVAALSEKEEFKNNPYQFYDNQQCDKIFNSLLPENKDSTISIFNTSRPNIILVLLEGWSAEAMGVLSKDIESTPRFSKLAEQGLLFTNFISTGFRTEQALAAITAGFPSQPKTTIIRKFGKFDNMPSFVKDLYNNGYHTSYYYGGDLNFANTEAYLKSAGYKKIIGQNDFQYKRFTEWGAFDDELFNYTLNDLKNNKQPFFSMIMTSTSHEPFTKDIPQIFKGDESVDGYLNVMHFSDESLFKFIESSKKESWYQNTIFMIVTDHTNRLPKWRDNFEINRHWIPCMFYGAALKNEFKGKTIDFPVSHVDFPAIILAQLGLAYDKFKWSKNIFDKNYQTPWAFYTFDEGFGFLKNKDKIVYDIKLNKLIVKTESKTINDSLTKEGKTLLQKLLDDYISLSK